jgi:Holliday junction resolvase RusA-like endonuclease
MKPLEFTLYGDPRTKKNSRRHVTVQKPTGGEYTMPLPSKQFSAYEKDCLKQITGFYRRRIATPVNLKAVYHMKTIRTVDLVNLLEGTCDILRDAGVVDDDNRNIIASTDGSRVYLDRKNPRVEITITDADPDYTQWENKKGVESRETLLDLIPGAVAKGR